jgi:hypothetical protein
MAKHGAGMTEAWTLRPLKQLPDDRGVGRAACQVLTIRTGS